MIKSIIGAALALSVVLSALALLFAGFDSGLAMASGAALSIVNLLAIKKLLEACLLQEKRETMIISMTLLVKFPLIYLAGYYLLAYSGLPIIYTLAGFSLIFAAALLTVTRTALVKS